MGRCKRCHGKATQRNTRIKVGYGLSEADFNRILQEQGGVCKICKAPAVRALDIDHCHTSLRVRGLLCRRCNVMLGMARDSLHTLKAAMAYLSDFNAKLVDELGGAT